MLYLLKKPIRVGQDCEGINLSKQEWEEFQKSKIWKAILYDIQDREEYLIELFKDNDQVWPADVIRGKLTELDFIRQIPVLIQASIAQKEQIENSKREISDAE
jgi:hypothetical protein